MHHIEDMAVNKHTGRTVVHYTTPDNGGAVCVLNPDGSIATHIEYRHLTASATRYNIELDRLHPAGGA